MALITPVEVAEKIIALLDSARYSTTYKLATLDAIVQVVTQSTDPDGNAPSTISAKAVGTKVLEIYWRQSVPFCQDIRGTPRYLRQSSVADIPFLVAEYRSQKNLVAHNDSLASARQVDPDGLTSLEKKIQARVIAMPIPKLQNFSNGKTMGDQFLYTYSWRDEVSASVVEQHSFDDAITLKPGIGEALIKIQILLKPYIENLWIQRVADQNRDITDAGKLKEFLFGFDRTSLFKIRPHLIDLQSDRCFYCAEILGSQVDVDHFLPFSKHGDDSLDNLVVSCRQCNSSKSDSYASLGHLSKWSKRFSLNTADWLAHERLHIDVPWPRDSLAVLAKARSVYLNKSDGSILWDRSEGMVGLIRTDAHLVLNS